MRTVEVRKGRVVESPWYRPEDAAAYVGLSISEFYARAKDVPHGGGRRLRLYHEKVLDRWLNGELPGIPFDPEDKPKEQPRRRRFFGDPGTVGIINPNNGKVRLC